MAAPPSYSYPVNPKTDQLPPYKASHLFANSQEELAALMEFAESQQYIQPGSFGTLPDIRGGWGVRTLAWGGTVQNGPSGYAGMILARPDPAADAEAQRRKAEEKERKKAERERRGSVTQRLKKVISRESRDSKGGAGAGTKVVS